MNYGGSDYLVRTNPNSDNRENKIYAKMDKKYVLIPSWATASVLYILQNRKDIPTAFHVRIQIICGIWF